jgi:O-antigen/teichoic acid export membrane protein
VQDTARLRTDRGSRARRTALLGITFQGVYAVAQLIALGLLVRAHGPERFGLWMTVLALTTWMPLAALGQPGGLLTMLGPVALTDRPAASRVLSSSTLLSTGSAALLLVLVLALGGLVPWSQLLNADGPLTAGSARTTAIAALAIAIASLPLVQAGYAILAHQRGDAVHVTNIAATLLVLGAVALAAAMRAPLWVLGTLSLLGPALGGVILWSVGLGSGLLPRLSWTAIDATAVRTAARAGLQFLIIDATTMLLLRTPEVIVARLFGVESVASFAAVGRLCALMQALFHAVLLPLWPAIGDAAARGDRAWIGSIGRRSLALVLGLWLVGALGLVLLGPLFIARWTGLPQLAERGLLLAAVGQTLGQALLSWLTVMLAGLGRQRSQVVATTLGAALFLPLALAAGSRLGPVGVAIAQAAALLLVVTPVAASALRRHRASTP